MQKFLIVAALALLPFAANAQSIGGNAVQLSSPFCPFSTVSGGGTCVQRDSDSNARSNNFVSGATTTTATGGTVNLTAASARLQVLEGTLAETYRLPDATTLTTGWTFQFNNNSTQPLTITDFGASFSYTIPADSYVLINPLDVSTANGIWDPHALATHSATWGSAALVFVNGVTTTPEVLTTTASATVPVFIPQYGAPTTGVGGDGTSVDLIVGGADIVHVDATSVTVSRAEGLGGATLSGSTLAAAVPASTTGVGTVSTSIGSPTVTGVGTLFEQQFALGDTITVNGETQTVTAIASNTSLTTLANWAGANSGLPFTFSSSSNVRILDNGNLDIGAATVGATNQALAQLYINKAFGDGTTGIQGVRVSSTVVSTSGARSGSSQALNINAGIGAANTQNWTNTSSGGFTGISAVPNIASGATGTISAMTGLRVLVQNNSAGATLTTAQGLTVDTFAATGTVTNMVGIGIDQPTLGATSNIGLLIAAAGNVHAAPPAGTFALYSISTSASYINGPITLHSATIIMDSLASTAQTNDLCYNSGTGLVTYQPHASGCVVSSRRFKQDFSDITPNMALPLIMALHPESFRYKKSSGMDDGKRHYGLIAEDVAKVFPGLVIYEKDGKTVHSVKYNELAPFLIAAMQAQEEEIKRLTIWLIVLSIVLLATATFALRKRATH